MSHRIFRDRQGVEWQVWDVFPSTDVRHTLEGGWLTFQSDHEKRRLVPVPLYWATADDAELERLLSEAKAVSHSPRRVADGEDRSAPAL